MGATGAVFTDEGTLRTGGVTDAAGVSPRGSTKLLALAAEASHTCGLHVDGSAECWGDNSDGQLDVPTGEPDYPAGFLDVASGADFTCGLTVANSPTVLG